MTAILKDEAIADSRPASPQILILACGNSLRGDDGVGLRIASALEDHPRDGVEIITTQQLLPEHAEAVSAAGQVIFVDCSALAPAGTVSITPVEPAGSLPGIFTHSLDPSTLLRVAQELYRRTPSRAVAVTIGGESFELNEELSAPVAAAVQHALEAVWARLATGEAS
jgi:hydrogenase maturation protease